MRRRIKHLEDDEQKNLFTWANHYKQLKWMHAIPNGVFLHGDARGRAKQMHRLKSQGLTPGVWDIFLPEPLHGYHGLYIEMKIGKNTLSDKQESFGDHVHNKGYLTHVCYGWLEAKQVISDYMGI